MQNIKNINRYMHVTKEQYSGIEDSALYVCNKLPQTTDVNNLIVVAFEFPKLTSYLPNVK